MSKLNRYNYELDTMISIVRGIYGTDLSDEIIIQYIDAEFDHYYPPEEIQECLLNKNSEISFTEDVDFEKNN